VKIYFPTSVGLTSTLIEFSLAEKTKIMETKNQKLKPFTGDALGYGWDIMMKYFLRLFLLVLVLGIVSIPLSVTNYYQDVHAVPVLLQLFAFAYILFIMAPFKYTINFLFLKNIRNKEFEMNEIIGGFKGDVYMNIVLARLLSTAIIGIGIFLLIVPGIIFACRLAFVPYLVMDKKLDPIKAVEESWRLTKGYGWRIFALGLLSFFIAIAGLIVLFVGVIVSVMWINAAFAAMYQAVIEEKGEYVEVPENPNGD